MPKVQKIIRLQSKKLDNLVLAMQKDLSMPLIATEQSADKIHVFNKESNVHLNEQILVRMMCDGTVIYTFEWLDCEI